MVAGRPYGRLGQVRWAGRSRRPGGKRRGGRAIMQRWLVGGLLGILLGVGPGLGCGPSGGAPAREGGTGPSAPPAGASAAGTAPPAADAAASPTPPTLRQIEV